MAAHSRVAALDSVRGIAAVVVLLHHCMIAFPATFELLWGPTPKYFSFEWRRLITFSPIHALWDGEDAVIVFFVLSGFVLAMLFADGKSGTYPQYLIRRFCRIYLPFAVAIGVAAVLCTYVPHTYRPEGDAWLNEPWSSAPSLGVVLGHLAMTGLDWHMRLNSVMWSLVHEVRISILFPVIWWTVSRRPRLAIALSVAALIASDVWLPHNPWIKTILDTGRYATCFVAGAFLVKHRGTISERLKSVRASGAFSLLCAGILLIEFRWLAWQEQAVALVATTAGAALIIALASNCQSISAALCTKPLLWLGGISYSLYLTHLIVLSAAVRLFPATPLPVVLVCVVPAAFAAAHAFNVLVERPAQDLGKRLASAAVVTPASAQTVRLR